MNQYVTGAVIKELREKNKMTQTKLADSLGVSDKTVSKWETGKGYPDITLLEPIAKIFHISVTELISGNTVKNANVSSNMLRSSFYVCPVCGNVIHGMGQAVITCHGIELKPEVAEQTEEDHKIFVERIEDEYYLLDDEDEDEWDDNEDDFCENLEDVDDWGDSDADDWDGNFYDN